MRIAHLSDLHYSPKHLKWADKAMSAAVDRAIQEQCDAAVISGDSLDHGMGLHEPAVAAFVRQVVRLAEHMPVLVLQGTASHDRPGSLDVLKEIPTRHSIRVADEPRMYVLSSEGLWDAVDEIIETDIAMFCCLPSINKADPEIMKNGAQHYVTNIMQQFSLNTSDARNAGIPSILVTHGTINGSLTESKYAMISPDHEFSEQLLFGAGADAVMIGHIHAHQDWHEGAQVIAYPGSLSRLVHGDHDPKGWLLWDIEPGSVMYQFIESPTRQLFEIDFDGLPDMNELTEFARQASEDDAVRVRWTVDQEHAHSVDKPAIRALFDHCDSLKLEGTILPVQSIRAAGISKALTMEDKLAYWLGTTGDKDKQPVLVDRLDKLRSMEPGEVVDQILNVDRILNVD